MYELWVPRSGTYIMKPTASCEAAQLWVQYDTPTPIVPRRGTDASTMMLRIIVGPALRNQERVRGHGADWLFCYGRLRGYGETP